MTSRPRVLVVDDDLTSLTYCRRLVEKLGYDVEIARSGYEAETILRRSDPLDCMVIDQNMPGMTGLDLLARMVGIDSDLAVLVASGESEKKLVEGSMRCGAVGFLDKPVSAPLLYSEVDRAIAATRHRRRLRRIELDAEQMGHAQRALLRSSLNAFADVTMDICYFPKHSAGGDLIFCFRPSPHHFLLLVADVSGHDLKAAFLAAYFQGIVRGMLEGGSNISQILSRFNQLLAEEWNAGVQAPISLAASAILADTRARTISVTVCGAPMPLCITPAGEITPLGVPSHPLGWTAEQITEQVGSRYDIGSTFCVWTDGLQDAADDLGVDPLSLAYRLRENKRQGIVPSFLESARDDILVAYVYPNDPDAPFNTYNPLVSATYLRQDMHQIDEWQAGWERSLALALPTLPEGQLVEVLLCGREAILNALKHGCSDPEDAATFDIAFNSVTQRLRLRIEDPGPGHDFNVDEHDRQNHREIVDEHFGLIMMSKIAKAVKRERRGAKVTIDCEATPEITHP